MYQFFGKNKHLLSIIPKNQTFFAQTRLICNKLTLIWKDTVPKSLLLLQFLHRLPKIEFVAWTDFLAHLYGETLTLDRLLHRL